MNEIIYDCQLYDSFGFHNRKIIHILARVYEFSKTLIYQFLGFLKFLNFLYISCFVMISLFDLILLLKQYQNNVRLIQTSPSHAF